MYSQHNYNSDHIWNFNEIRIQVDKQYKAKVLARKGYNVVNNKYFKIYHKIIKHVIWLGRKIEVNMVRDFM